MTTTTRITSSPPVCSKWLAALPLLAGALVAQAQFLDIRLLNNGAQVGDWHPAIIQGANGYSVNDVTYNPAGASIRCYNMTLGYDPFLSASVSVVNNTAAIQHYTLIFTLPITPQILGGSLMGGSTQGGITDGNFDGVGTISTAGAGTALYHGQIDGVDVLSLFPHLSTINVPFAGGSASSSASAGLPGVTIPGPNVLTSIGIKEDFTLTPGDTATFSSFFVAVEAVPEPGSLSLLALGGVLLVWRRRLG